MLQQKKISIDNENNSIHDVSSLHNTSSSSSDTTPSSGAQNDKNKIAEHILFRLRQKLEGFENGVKLSCIGQVNLLIQEAINPENLARLYAGWQPYL
jgi:ataxia telangiectasia mutated family protein